MKPLFIPLKAEFFNAFESGEKDTEYRIYGPRWNERTCLVGRKVTLSYGYGKKRRIAGEIISFTRNFDKSTIKGWTKCYGVKPCEAVAIKISKLRHIVAPK